MRDGSVGWNPGKLNPNIVLPAGPIDPEVSIVYAEKPDATGPTQSVATYVNFAAMLFENGDCEKGRRLLAVLSIAHVHMPGNMYDSPGSTQRIPPRAVMAVAVVVIDA